MSTRSSILVFLIFVGATHTQLAAQLVERGLLLDLDADKGIEVEEGDRIVKWTNQVAQSAAKDFVKRDKGRQVPGSGRPSWKKSVKAINGHNTVVFRRQELLNHNEDAFDKLVTGDGYTWLTAMCVFEQVEQLKDVNSIFGNLRSGGNYEGIWGNLTDDNRVWIGSRNAITFGRWDKNNPMVVAPESLALSRYYVVAGRMGSGTGQVPIELFINTPRAVAQLPFPVNPNANSSKMAIGAERDATNHPGKEAFDGELARLLIYHRPLSNAELTHAIEHLKKTYTIK